MSRADVNCMIGNWPFRKLWKNTWKDLQKVHADNGITTGFVSSLNSIFYNDPFEGEEELHDIIRNTPYHHVMTVNPALPCSSEDIRKGVRLFDVKGVKIFPEYHNYTLDDPCVAELCDTLEELRLPLFIPLRMEDERLNYMMTPRIFPMDELSRFAENHKNLTIVYLNIRMGEISECKKAIQACPHVYFDTSGLKDQLFVVEKLVKEFDTEKILYGSLFPLYCLRSTSLMVDLAEVPEEVKKRIFYDNAVKALLPR